MLGRIVNLNTFSQTTRLGGRKGLVKGGCRVGVQVVADHNDFLRFGISVLQHIGHFVSPVYSGALWANVNVTPVAKRFCEQEQTGRSCTFIFVIVTPNSASALGAITQHCCR